MAVLGDNFEGGVDRDGSHRACLGRSNTAITP